MGNWRKITIRHAIAIAIAIVVYSRLHHGRKAKRIRSKQRIVGEDEGERETKFVLQTPMVWKHIRKYQMHFTTENWINHFQWFQKMSNGFGSKNKNYVRLQQPTTNNCIFHSDNLHQGKNLFDMKSRQKNQAEKTMKIKNNNDRDNDDNDDDGMKWEQLNWNDSTIQQLMYGIWYTRWR